MKWLSAFLVLLASLLYAASAPISGHSEEPPTSVPILGSAGLLDDSLLNAIMQLPGGETFLTMVLGQLEKDQIEIDKLRGERNTLQDDLWGLRQQLTAARTDLKGFNVSVGAGWPLSGSVGLGYRFKRWAPFITGVFGQTNYIGAGLQFQLAK